MASKNWYLSLQSPRFPTRFTSRHPYGRQNLFGVMVPTGRLTVTNSKMTSKARRIEWIMFYEMRSYIYIYIYKFWDISWMNLPVHHVGGTLGNDIWRRLWPSLATNSSSGPMWDLDRPLKQAFSSIQGILPDAEFGPSFASVFKDYSKVSSA
jgi:hypothetical protein